MRPRWRDVALAVGALAGVFVAGAAVYFLVLTSRASAGSTARRDADRQAIIAEMEFHRCRSEQLWRGLYAHQGVPVPPYPDGVVPPHPCTLTEGS